MTSDARKTVVEAKHLTVDGSYDDVLVPVAVALLVALSIRDEQHNSSFTCELRSTNRTLGRTGGDFSRVSWTVQLVSPSLLTVSASLLGTYNPTQFAALHCWPGFQEPKHVANDLCLPTAYLRSGQAAS